MIYLLFPKGYYFDTIWKIIFGRREVYLLSIYICIYNGSDNYGITPTSLFGGYAFSKLAFKGSNFLFCSFINYDGSFQSLLIPLYNLLNKLNLLDTKLGLSLVYSTFSCLLYFYNENLFSSLPTALRESAVLDGASELKILFKVYISISSVLYIHGLSLLETWNILYYL